MNLVQEQQNGCFEANNTYPAAHAHHSDCNFSNCVRQSYLALLQMALKLNKNQGTAQINLSVQTAVTSSGMCWYIDSLLCV